MISKIVLCLCVASLNGLPQVRNRVRLPSSYLAPLQDQETAPSKTILTSFGPPTLKTVSQPVSSLYSGPIADEEPAASSTNILSSYGDEVIAPSEPVSLYSAPSDLARDFDYNEINFIGDYDIQRDVDYSASVISETINDYGTPKASVIVNDYSQPQGEILTSASSLAPASKAPVVVTTRKIVNDYTQPQADVITTSLSSLKNDYSQPRANVISFTDNNDLNEYGSSDRVASGSSLSSSVVKAVKSPPVALLRSENTGINDGRFSYGYEAENGISQDVSGEMKTINDAQVYVMRGSYSFIGTDGQTYKVEWFADETGYHPSAPFLPKSVEPNHPEVAAAVRAQLEFAAQEEAAAAASTNNVVYAAPEDYDDIYATNEELSGYGA